MGDMLNDQEMERYLSCGGRKLYRKLLGLKKHGLVFSEGKWTLPENPSEEAWAEIRKVIREATQWGQSQTER
jgi:hypothetical protein